MCVIAFSRIHGKDSQNKAAEIEPKYEAPIFLAKKYAASPDSTQPIKIHKLTESIGENTRVSVQRATHCKDWDIDDVFQNDTPLGALSRKLCDHNVPIRLRI